MSFMRAADEVKHARPSSEEILKLPGRGADE
jgi:hypothetical protein